MLAMKALRTSKDEPGGDPAESESLPGISLLSLVLISSVVVIISIMTIIISISIMNMIMIMDSLRGSSVEVGTIRIILARPLRKDDAHT